MINLYQSIKSFLNDTYGYADLESVFTIVKSISVGVKYTDLGFTSAYAISSFQNDLQRCIVTADEKDIAAELLERYKAFVKKKCRASNFTEEKITETFADLFDKLATKFNGFRPIPINGIVIHIHLVVVYIPQIMIMW
jgi:hypothetical protein